jgi:UDP-N-acetylglucosamine 2-epimerase (non-hydrolysing)
MREAKLKVCTLATGQHDTPALADSFFKDLRLEPDIRWLLPSSECERVGTMLARAYDVLSSGDFHAVLLLGDTYTVPLFALAARRFGIPLVHLEAGLRSFNMRSVEEGNRRLVTSLTALHLAPTALAARMLDAEGVPANRIRVVGNPVTDSLRKFGPRRRPIEGRSGLIVTLHRPTNVDDPTRLGKFVDLIKRLGADVGAVRFPVHPRTRDHLVRNKLLHDVMNAPGVTLEAPLRYGQMLAAVASSHVVVTDSGGLQEEAAWYGVPVVVLRKTTPRWESVIRGASMLVGDDTSLALKAVHRYLSDEEQRRVAALRCPYGDGRVAGRIASILAHPSTDQLIEVREPYLAGQPPTPSAGGEA